MDIRKLKVLLVASEAVPFAKVGGLADVVGALGKELKENGFDVKIIIPKYSEVYYNIDLLKLKVLSRKEYSVTIETEEDSGFVEEVDYKGLTYLLIDKPDYYKRNGIYVDQLTRHDFSDNLKRFVFFSKSVLESIKVLDFQPDIIHSHDWQTGLISVYLKTVYKMDSFFKTSKSLFTIHNLSYQGIFPVEQYTVTGLDWKYFSINSLEYYGHLNLMKGGIVFSDFTATVSETYAKEIQTPEYGNGLEGVIRDKSSNKKLIGISNGVDYSEWDPELDTYIKGKYKIQYNFKTIDKKQEIKRKFLEDNGIKNPDVKRPLIGMISRLVDQKGFDIIFECIDRMVQDNIYFAILGNGKYEYENRLQILKDKYADKIIVQIGFDIPMSHYIEAASDIYLMPSRFEPCGLNQLYSMKYGTIPIVRKTGGLADTVKDGKTGLMFDNYNPDELYKIISKSINIYNKEPEVWKKMMQNAMNEDWSWKSISKKYLSLYNQIISE